LSDHLSPTTLNALADGELSADQLARANEHLATCPQCTTTALGESLLKNATARAGQRYTPPANLRDRMQRLAIQDARAQAAASASAVTTRNFSSYGWASAAALILVFASIVLLQRTLHRDTLAAADYSALVTEISDQHISTLAAGTPPQVISSDRHTVKPWFQGKLPFSFNLPQNLPADVTLDGANLAYVRNQPTAQLLYSVGRHRVSVFIRQTSNTSDSDPRPADYQGFHVIGFRTGNVEALAVSDVDPARLSELVREIQGAQTAAPPK
jgi:anti-sigma factor RsiW